MLPEQKNNNVSTDTNNILSKDTHLLSQCSIISSKLSSIDATNFSISSFAEATFSSPDENTVKDEELSILCNNSNQHCKHCQKKQLTLEKQLINTQQKLTEMRQMIQRVGIIANVLLKNEERHNNSDKFVNEKTIAKLSEQHKERQLTMSLANIPDLEKLCVLLN